MTYRVGIDIGGTFTDFVLLNDDHGDICVHKRLTTPEDPAIAVLAGLDQLLQEAQVSVSSIKSIIHGSTLVTNAVIERKGATVGMLVTNGFIDVLDIALEQRYDLYQLDIQYPTPLVSRDQRREINERIRYDGSIEIELDVDEVRRMVDELLSRHPIEAFAVCLLQSFINPDHENKIRDLIETHYPSVFVSTSASVLPYAREYERWTSTVINAFTQPLVDRYLSNIEQGLKHRGLQGSLYIMTSSGGTVTPATARRFPVRMLESGPAAGVLMSAHHGRKLSMLDVLSFDMGGTTAKGAIVRSGEPRRVYEIEIARIHESRKGSGLPVRVPVIDMIEIGAGGGSIAEVDDRNLIRVGPRSAGASPGPACYGLGGSHPTLTDANLVLGYYDPAFFLGGEMQLDVPAAEAAIRDNIAAPLGLDLARAAWGIHEIINEDVARAFRVHASEIGFDYRQSTMIAFGGSGPGHALRIARKMRIPRVILPTASGVMSALGMLVSPLSFQIAQSQNVLLDDIDQPAFCKTFSLLEGEASQFLVEAGVRFSDIRVIRRLDLRYFGQGHEIEVTLPTGEDIASVFPSLPMLFASQYAEIFSLSYLNEPLEIVNWKVEVWGPPADSYKYRPAPGNNSSSAHKGTRQAYFPEASGYIECPVYDRYVLGVGTIVTGPAIIEERESTLVVGTGDLVTLDAHGNLMAQIEFYSADSMESNDSR
ncbi:MAG: methylhydantoinase [Proteobacteria bacterium]|nr:methylhydantoinase [Pseudomonadota bacterium]